MNAVPNARQKAAAAFRAACWDGGWRPVALYSHDCTHAFLQAGSAGKRPQGDKWQERARRDPPEATAVIPLSDALETGLLCDGLRVLDIDIDDATTVAAVHALATRELGETIVRGRDNSSRVLLPYLAAEGHPGKRVLVGKAGKVEVLGHGQQFAAAQRHPSGAMLHWTPDGPDTTPVHHLPTITEAQLNAFFEQAAPMIGAAPPAALRTQPRAIAPRSPAPRGPSVHGPSADALDVIAALAVIPPDHELDWERWNRVGLATWAATGGSEAGQSAFVDWTERIHADHDRKPGERWEHYARHADRHQQAGAGTLFYLASLALPGWRKPSTVARVETPPAPPAMSFLTRTRVTAPGLPLEVFGPWWAEWIERAAAGANAPPDYVAAPLLAAASALIGNSRWVRGWPGWCEPPALWVASVGNPSSGKSPGAAPIMRDVLPLVEAHMARGYPEALDAWSAADQVAKAFEKQWERDLANAVKEGRPLPPCPPEARHSPAPIRPRAKVSDATTEALAVILQGLPKGVLHLRDELAGWLLNLQRYSGGTDRPFWLEAYVGGPFSVDRLKNPLPLYIPRLAVATFGTIQPDRLEECLAGADDGLAGRFLWTWPEPMRFHRPTRSSDVHAAALRLQRLVDLTMPTGEGGEPYPSFVPLDGPAADLLERFGQDMQAMEGRVQGLLLTSMGKARGQVLRLALVLQLLRWCADNSGRPEPTVVTVEAFAAAERLMRDYFLPMAARVLGDASIPVEERNARTLAEWIRRKRPLVVNVSAIRDGARLPGLRESALVKQACRFLADARWLTPIDDTGEAGRPRGDWRVNPLVWADLT